MKKDPEPREAFFVFVLDVLRSEGRLSAEMDLDADICSAQERVYKLVYQRIITLDDLRRCYRLYSQRMASLTPEAETLSAIEPELPDGMPTADQFESPINEQETLDGPLKERSVVPEKVPPPVTKEFSLEREVIDQLKRQGKEVIGKYVLEKKLGEGGMGRVYLARDLILNRFVALKLLHAQDEEHLRRFMQEARLQAQIEHDGICRIYEVGETEGSPYIAMQYIEGVTLDEADRYGLTLTQKIRLLRDIALALHEAHRQGLVHRDIKPSNLMVARTGDGFRSYIMDFGLAREVDTESGLTVSGMILGTPGYMAPEQARGDNHIIDRRTDVFALGATLYEVVTRRRPFPGTNIYEILKKITEEDPVPPRKIVPDLPLDLETIILKCLDKDPNRRYASARDLADDLTRFLNGEPILARKISRAERWIRWSKRHKAVTALSALSLILAVIFLGLLWHQRRLAERRQKLATVFGQVVTEIENMARLARYQPFHSVDREEQFIRQQMAWIEKQMKQVGKVAEGPGNYALGRGYLALFDFDHAAIYLERAVQSHYEAPELYLTYGEVLGYLYWRERRSVELTVVSESARRAELEAIDRAYRQRALHYLTKAGKLLGEGRSLLETPAYARALIYTFDGRWEQALHWVQMARKEAPWLDEPQFLEADIARLRGESLKNQGKYKEALEQYHHASNIYQEVLKRAPSHALAYGKVCAVNGDMMWLESQKLGEAFSDDYRAAIDACSAALKIKADLFDARHALQILYYRWGRIQGLRGDDPTEALQRSVDLARTILRSRPNDARTMALLSLAFRELALYRMRIGKDPHSFLDQAIRMSRQNVQLHPNWSSAYMNLGLSLWTLARWQSRQGQDPTDAYRQAFKAYRKAIQILPTNAQAQANLATAYLEYADYLSSRGHDVDELLKGAEAAFRKALDLSPDDPLIWIGLGDTFNLQGLMAFLAGVDPADEYQKAEQAYRHALSINPDYPSVYINLASLLVNLADYEAKRGNNPGPLLKKVRVLCETGQEKGFRDSYLYYNCGLAEFIAIEYHLLKGEVLPELLANARQWLTMAEKIDPRDVIVLNAMVYGDGLEARMRVAQNKDPGLAIEKGLRRIRKIIRTSVPDAETYLYQARLFRIAAQWLMNLHQSPEGAIRRAQESLERALEKNPDLLEVHLEKAWLAYLSCQTEHISSIRHLECYEGGRKAIERVLTLNPATAEAVWLALELEAMGKGDRQTILSFIKRLQHLNPLYLKRISPRVRAIAGVSANTLFSSDRSTVQPVRKSTH